MTECGLPQLNVPLFARAIPTTMPSLPDRLAPREGARFIGLVHQVTVDETAASEPQEPWRLM